MTYPRELCCPVCEEVVALIERHIPIEEELVNYIDYLDTPFESYNRIEYCAICSGYVGHYLMGFIGLIRRRCDA